MTWTSEWCWQRLHLRTSAMGACAAALLLFSALLAEAQTIPFPQPDPTTAAASVSQYTARANVVIETNACGREDNLLNLRNKMAGGDFSSDTEGESLSHILGAKLAFIRSHARIPNTNCVHHMWRAKSDFPFYVEMAKKFPALGCAIESANPGSDPADVTVSVSPACMSAQIDDSIKAMQKTTQLGSSGIPCISHLSTGSDGEYDVSDREYVRLLYLSGSVGQRDGTMLDPSTIDYMYKNLLAARGDLSPASYPVLMGCGEPAGDSLGSPEDTADGNSWTHDVLNFLGHLFEWLVITYLTYGILPGAAPLVVAPFLLAGAGVSPNDLPFAHYEVYVSETENHRLNIETSKYLTNADMIARLEAEDYDGVDDLKTNQSNVRSWLLLRLQDIAGHDFLEYNARPYSRYSLNSLVNLNDFAGVHNDTDLATAAQVVLDLSEAKFAATSNRGRRVVPYRRLTTAEGGDSRYLYEAISGADHEVVRSMLLTGQTGLLDPNAAANAGDVLAEMVNTATSTYKLPDPVLKTAVERAGFEQTIHHASVEKVEQSPAFTISAGGLQTAAVNDVLGLTKDKDKGVALPTVIIPTLAGAYMHDLFRFDGGGDALQRQDNTCVAAGFACGIQPEMSDAFQNCQDTIQTGVITIFSVDSSKCFPGPGPHFFLAALITQCSTCSQANSWGIFDVVEAQPQKELPKRRFDLFQQERTAALLAVQPDADGHATYHSAAGQNIQLEIKNIFSLQTSITMLSIDGNPLPAWSTDGGRLTSDGNGTAIIKSVSNPFEHIFFPPGSLFGSLPTATKTIK